MIPEKWCIQRTPDNYKKVNEYFSEKTDFVFSANGQWYDSGKFKYDYLHFPKIDNKRVKGYTIEPGYTEISFETFKKYIMEIKELPKEYIVQLDGSDDYYLFATWYNKQFGTNISGYSKYFYRVPYIDLNSLASGLSQIEDYKKLPIVSFNEWKELVKEEKKEENKKGNIIGYKLLKDLPGLSKNVVFEKAGSDWISDAWIFSQEQIDKNPDWFEPIYAPNFKKGDYVTTLNGFSTAFREENFGGSGYKENLTFKLDYIIECPNPERSSAYSSNMNAGIYFKALRLATQDEIDSIRKLKIGSPAFDVTINQDDTVSISKWSTTPIRIEEVKALINNLEQSMISGNLVGRTYYSNELSVHFGCSDGPDIKLSELKSIIELHENI